MFAEESPRQCHPEASEGPCIPLFHNCSLKSLISSVETVELTKAAILDILHRHREEIMAFGVCKIGLFGSFVHDAQHADSDIDILVHFRKDSKKLKNLIGLAECLESWFQTKVDLVTPESLSPITGYHILNEVEYAAIAC